LIDLIFSKSYEKLVLSLYFSVLGQFLISLGAQIIVWRALRRTDDVVTHQILWLFALYLGGPLVHFYIEPSVSQLILAVGLGCTYIMSFPAASAKSPSLLLIDVLDREGPQTKEELEAKLLKSVNLVEDRLRDMQADGLVSKNAKEFRPSRAGRFLGYVFWYYRRLLGLPLGEG
jgi:hypothetical protein